MCVNVILNDSQLVVYGKTEWETQNCDNCTLCYACFIDMIALVSCTIYIVCSYNVQYWKKSFLLSIYVELVH